MQQTMSGQDVQFPVDNATYNLMTTLTEKLSAIETYATYIEDAEGDEAQLYQQLMEDDTRHAERIYEVLRDRISR